MLNLAENSYLNCKMPWLILFSLVNLFFKNLNIPCVLRIMFIGTSNPQILKKGGGDDLLKSSDLDSLYNFKSENYFRI